MKVTEDTLNGYLIAIAEVNLDANHGCEYNFRKVDIFSADLDEVFKKHFSSEYNPAYSDYESYIKVENSDSVLKESLHDWFYDKDKINGTYKEDEDERVETFLKFLEIFKNGKEMELFEIKNKGGFFIMSDFYILKIEEEMYSLEFGVND